MSGNLVPVDGEPVRLVSEWLEGNFCRPVRVDACSLFPVPHIGGEQELPPPARPIPVSIRLPLFPPPYASTRGTSGTTGNTHFVDAWIGGCRAG
jgi:hypothetical protein